MKAIGAVAFAAFVTIPLAAQDASSAAPPQPDYSRENLQRIFLNVPEEPKRESSVEFDFGSVSFKALGTRWRYVYLPLLAPLSGSIHRTTNEWPDPFSLTGTEIAQTPRTFASRRAVNAELRRIDRITKKVKVSVKAE